LKRASSALAAVALLVAVGLSNTTNAELAHDVDLVLAELRHVAIALPIAPKFYSSGGVTPVALPASAWEGAAPGCTTALILGATSTSFALRLPAPGSDDDQPEDDVVPSVAGIATVARCGIDRAAFSELVLEMRSPHGVIEGVIAESSGPLQNLRALLPHRDPGAVAEAARPGPPPIAAPLLDRSSAVERRLREAHAVDLERRLAPTDQSGSGHILLTLEPGCHLIAALGMSAPTDELSPHDIDAELTWVSGGTAAVDRTESPDATLMVCNGSRQAAMLSFAGSPPEVPVLILRGRIALPPSIPERFGEEPRARIAKTLIERHIAVPQGRPTYESFGVGGITDLPLEVVPGECYLAAVAPLQDGAKLVSLAITEGAFHSASHTDDGSDAAIVTWCAGAAERATLEVELHGATPPLWIAAVWPSGRHEFGEDLP
jgi:hypothetical protein